MLLFYLISKVKIYRGRFIGFCGFFSVALLTPIFSSLAYKFFCFLREYSKS